MNRASSLSLKLMNEREAMVKALQLTERNLTSLINAKHSDAVLMSDWRAVVRRALA